MADESNVIDFPIRSSGAQEAAQAIGGVVAALKNTQAALDVTNKGAKAASDAVGGLSKEAKTANEAMAGATAQAKAAAKEKDALAKAATSAAQAMAKERAAAAELVSSTLSPLTKEQDKLTKQIGQLATELGRLREERAKALAGGFDQRTLQIDTRIANTQEALGQLRGQRLSLSQQSITSPGGAVVDVTQAKASMDGFALASSRSAAVLNVIGGELVHINPEFATMTQAVGRASGSISGFTSLLGGPYALAIGAVVAGIGLWIDSTRREAEEQDKLAAAIKKTNEEFEKRQKQGAVSGLINDPQGAAAAAAAGVDLGVSNEEIASKRRELLTKIDALKNQRDAEAARDQRVGAMGAADTLVVEDIGLTPERKAQIETQLSWLQQRFDQLGEFSKRRGEIQQKNAQSAAKLAEDEALAEHKRAEKEAADKRAAEAKRLAAEYKLSNAGANEALAQKRAAEGPGEYKSETQALDRAEKEQRDRLLPELQRTADERVAIARKAAEAQIEAEKEKTATIVKLAEAGALRQADIDRNVIDIKSARDRKTLAAAEAAQRKQEEADSTTIDGAEEVARHKAKVSAQEQANAETYQQMGTRAYQQVSVIGINALSALAKGQHVTGKMILASVGDMMVAEGTRTIFQGLAMSANPLTPGAGAGMIGVGTAEIAAGISIGAATRGSTASSGGSTGTPVATAPNGQVYWNGSSWERGNPYAPAPANANYGTQPVNVYNTVQMSSVVAPNDQDGIRVQRALDEAHRSGALRRPKAS